MSKKYKVGRIARVEQGPDEFVYIGLPCNAYLVNEVFNILGHYCTSYLPK